MKLQPSFSGLLCFLPPLRKTKLTCNHKIRPLANDGQNTRVLDIFDPQLISSLSVIVPIKSVEYLLNRKQVRQIYNPTVAIRTCAVLF